MIPTYGEIYHVLGLEELILLKYRYYPKQYTDLMNSYQNTHDIFHRTIANNLKICVESQKYPDNQSNLEKKEQTWKYHAP